MNKNKNPESHSQITSKFQFQISGHQTPPGELKSSRCCGIRAERRHLPLLARRLSTKNAWKMDPELQLELGHHWGEFDNNFGGNLGPADAEPRRTTRQWPKSPARREHSCRPA